MRKIAIAESEREAKLLTEINRICAGRNAIIEQCALVAEKHLARYDHMEHVAAAIRGLKDRQP